MHSTLEALKAGLDQLAEHIESTVPANEPFGVAHSNWSFPALTQTEMTDEARSITKDIDFYGGDDLGQNEEILNDYVRRLSFLRKQTVGQMWGNAAQAVPAYLFTLQGLRKALEPVLKRDVHAESVVKLRKLAGQLRSMEAKLNAIAPRTETLAAMIERIERAHDAADQLPTDLETLAEARQQIAELARAASQDEARIGVVRQTSESIEDELRERSEQAAAVLERCETAYSAATTIGLSAAFNERSKTLSNSMWIWVGGLVLALAAGSIFGTGQLRTLSELFRSPNASPSVVTLNLFLSILSVGAPIWFAWLATKQIGQRFRLAEDYAFKASISRAYEGFRREAARFDKEMEAKLLTSALTRLDELPLRLVETTTHGSPWHELASSDVVKQALLAVPGFTNQVKDLAAKSVDKIKPSKPKAAAVTSPDD